MNSSYNGPEAYRHVPHDVDVEQALLGAILVGNRALERPSALLKAEDFFDPLHGRIFETMTQMIERGAAVTPVTMYAAMKSDPGVLALKWPGGENYFDLLEMNAPVISSVKDYALILADLAARRALIRMGEDIASAAYSPPSESTTAQLLADDVLIHPGRAAKVDPSPGGVTRTRARKLDLGRPRHFPVCRLLLDAISPAK